jgi:hypothetical protein
MISVDLAYNLHSAYGNWFPGIKPLIVQVRGPAAAARAWTDAAAAACGLRAWRTARRMRCARRRALGPSHKPHAYSFGSCLAPGQRISVDKRTYAFAL